MKHKLEIVTIGQPVKVAEKALIMIHGRGGSAQDILRLSQYLNVDGYALMAPQATNNTWYPYSFMEAVEANQPWLDSALEVVDGTVRAAVASGIKEENIYFFGFSQGACLVSEYLARNAQQFGGAAIIIGGVIGDEIERKNYKGDFKQTPIFLGTSDPDFHVPVERVCATEEILKGMNADVTVQVYENAGHTINQEEIGWANRIVFK